MKTLIRLLLSDLDLHLKEQSDLDLHLEEQSDLDLHCFPRHVCTKTYHQYGKELLCFAVNFLIDFVKDNLFVMKYA